MNIGSIVSMIDNDPTILDDLAAFRQRMNAMNVVVNKEVVRVVETITETTSIARIHGGPCTVADLQAAVKWRQLQVFRQRASQAMDEIAALVQAGIEGGTVTNINTLKTALQQAATQVIGAM